MADHNDGSIIIDTELDNDGFEKGSGKLLNAVKDLTNAVDNMGDNMMQSFGQITPLLSSIAGSVSQLTGSMKAEATQMSAANEELVASEQRVASSAQQTAGVLANSSGVAQTSASGLEKQINSINNSLEAVSRSAESGFSSGSAVLSFDNKLNTLEGNLDKARAQLEAFGNTKIPTDEYTELSQCIEKASKDLEALRERQVTMEDTGVKKNSRAWQTVEYQIQAVKRVLDDYKIDLATLESSGQAFVMGSDTEEFARMTRSVEEATGSLERNRSLIDSEAIAQARLNVQAAQEGVIRAETASQRQAAMQQLTSAQQSLNDLATAMSRKGGADPSSWERFTTPLYRLRNAAVSAAKSFGTLMANIAKSGLKTAANGIKSLTSRLKSFISSSKSASNHANILTKTLTSLKTMLKSRIKRMFISSIISNVKEGLKDLASYDSTFNTSMSNIKNGAKELTSNLSVTLGRLIQIVEPILTTIINAASKAVSYFNALLSMLGGGSSVVVAKKQMDSYADSTSDAASATEELKNQVYGFDKLNKRSDSSSSSSSSDSNLYETQDVNSLLPDSVASYFDKIKDAFTSGDWEGLGELVAQGFNTAFDKVDSWINSTLRPKAVKWAGNIASMLNGLVSGLNWAGMGRMLSSGINTVFDVLNTFLSTFDFEALGNGIGDALSEMIRDIDWKMVAETFSNMILGLIGLITGIVNHTDWSAVGQAIIKFITNFKLEDIVDGATRLVNSLAIAITQVDFKSVGEAFRKKIANVNWKGLWDGVVNLLTSALQGAGDFLGFDIDTSNLKQALQDVYEPFSELFSTLKESFGTLLKPIVNELLPAAVRVIGSIASALKPIITALTPVLKTVISVIARIFDALAPVVALVGEVIGKIIDVLAPILEPILNLIAEIVEMLSPALEDILTLVSEIFTALEPFIDIVVTILEPIMDAIKGIVQVLRGVIEFVVGVFTGDWDKAWQGIKDIFEGIWNAIVGIIEGVWEAIKGIFEAAWEFIKGVWDVAVSFFSGLWEGIKEVFSPVIEWLGNVFSKAWEGIKTAWNAVVNFFSGIWTGIKNVFSGIGEWFGNIFTKAWNGIKTAWNGVINFFSGIWNGIKNAFGAVADWFKNIFSKAWQAVKNVFSTGGKVFEGIKDGIVSAFKTVVNAIIRGINKVIAFPFNAINGFLDTIRGVEIFGWKPFDWVGRIDVPQIPELEYGGVLKKGQVALLEGKGSEAVVPLERNTGWINRVADQIGKYLSNLNRTPASQWLSIVSDIVAGISDIAQTTVTTLSGIIAQSVAEIRSAIYDSNGSGGLIVQLNDIVITFKDIANMLTAMGGFTVPQIAAGTIVPAKTRIASSGDTNGAYGLPAAFTDGVDEQLDDITMLLRQIIALIKALNLNIDIDALTNMITRRQKSNARNYGGNV